MDGMISHFVHQFCIMENKTGRMYFLQILIAGGLRDVMRTMGWL
jgi:hypothetical protein